MALTQRYMQSELPSSQVYGDGQRHFLTTPSRSATSVLPETMQYTRQYTPFATLQSMQYDASLTAPLQTIRGGYSGEDVTRPYSAHIARCAMLGASQNYSCK